MAYCSAKAVKGAAVQVEPYISLRIEDAKA
jgi:hypothetical protein